MKFWRALLFCILWVITLPINILIQLVYFLGIIPYWVWIEKCITWKEAIGWWWTGVKIGCVAVKNFINTGKWEFPQEESKEETQDDEELTEMVFEDLGI